MKRLVGFGVVTTIALMMLSLSWAAANLNLSKSNINRLIVPADVMSPAQAASMLAELDKLGPVNEARLRQVLPEIMRKVGVQPERFKQVIIRPADQTHKQTDIILLSNPADAAQALALLTAGMPAGKPPMSAR